MGPQSQARTAAMRPRALVADLISDEVRAAHGSHVRAASREVRVEVPDKQPAAFASAHALVATREQDSQAFRTQLHELRGGVEDVFLADLLLLIVAAAKGFDSRNVERLQTLFHGLVVRASFRLVPHP